MIFITGDTHGDITNLKLYDIEEQYPNLTKKDYVIVAGDFGGCWDEQQLLKLKEMMKHLSYTILFVDGNHENFDILNSYEVEQWNGGNVHRLFDDVIHLMRGEIFNIDGMIFLALGGAESKDKDRRTEHASWWSEESITYEDIEKAKENLKKYDNRVDYVITHTLPARELYQQPFYQLTRGIPDNSELWLQDIADIISFKQWFFGHWHMDVELRRNFHCLYNEFIVIRNN